MVNGYQRTVADHDLARVRVDLDRSFPGEVGMRSVMTGSSTLGVGDFGPLLPVDLPSHRTEYYSAGPGIESAGQFSGSSPDGAASADSTPEYPVAYQPGVTYHERWNAGVFAPSLPTRTALGMSAGITRTGDQLQVDVPLYGDGAGRPGDTSGSTSAATLYRDGTQIASADGNRGLALPMPDGNGSYRLELHAERGAPFVLSTTTDIAWTFGSAPTNGPTALPLWTVRFSPSLDDDDSAPAGRVVAVPVAAIPQAGAPVGKLTKLTVEASVDDGATWKAVRVSNGAALVPDPGGSGFVSLRATAADSRGNTVTLTVIHAYGYGRAA
ncbi:hypothetical protein GCM10023322_33830 [Rugosimonospora acidiphila]|uniref:Uncharacterized protein n=1 Tax=Rugosimonospora acidiphila TaxID=556531 RepID=A0ABP9RUJ8_9ACTN